MSLKWDGRCSGVYHQQYSYDAGESVLEVFTDSDETLSVMLLGFLWRMPVVCCITYPKGHQPVISRG